MRSKLAWGILTCALALPAFAAIAVVAAPLAGAAQPTDGASRTQQEKPGYLTIATTPPARLFVDDADTGKTTPVEKHELSPGRHKLTLVSLDGRLKRTLGIVITSGEAKRVNVNL